ncbi:MAG: DmsC/YnfH family molybdoenzyme membrane anchor subunit, partial [Coriobacteriales bacterium]
MAISPGAGGASAGERRELPLICFTLLSPASAGVVCGAIAMGKAMDIWLALVALVLVSIGMAGSILHLARPLLAPTSLRNVASSCLSREIVVVSAYWVVALAWCACCLLAPELRVLVWALCLCAMAMGCVLIVAIGNAYLLTSQPAWNGREVYAELAGVAASVGGPAAASVAVLEALVRGSATGSLLIAIAAGCILSAIGAALGHAARRARA